MSAKPDEKLEFVAEKGVNEEKLSSFSVDGLRTGKFAHVESLEVDDSIKWRTSLPVARPIFKSLVNLEKLKCLNWLDGDNPIATELWSIFVTSSSLTALKKS